MLAIGNAATVGIVGIKAAHALDGRSDFRVGESALPGQQQAKETGHAAGVHRTVLAAHRSVSAAIGVFLGENMAHGAEQAAVLGDVHRISLDGGQNQRVIRRKKVFGKDDQRVAALPSDHRGVIALVRHQLRHGGGARDQRTRLGLGAGHARGVVGIGRVVVVGRQQAQGAEGIAARGFHVVLLRHGLGHDILEPPFENQRRLRTVVGRGGAVGTHRFQHDLHRARHTGPPTQQLESGGIPGLGRTDGQPEGFAGIAAESHRLCAAAIHAEDHVIRCQDSGGGRSGCHLRHKDLAAGGGVLPRMVGPATRAGGPQVEGDGIAGNPAVGQVRRRRHRGAAETQDHREGEAGMGDIRHVNCVRGWVYNTDRAKVILVLQKADWKTGRVT